LQLPPLLVKYPIWMQYLENLFWGQIRLAPGNLGNIELGIEERDHGEVAERPNAGALKAPEGKLSGGSNPSLAASDRGIDGDECGDCAHRH